ncbi:hypothetical protein, partial [Acidithiobacillus sp. HP-11]|uniref:hypothetical protein n=1 Tax=Acidithiobacillus sp. HP-11 TaxID=2697656 RepID=UPI001D0D5AD8
FGLGDVYKRQLLFLAKTCARQESCLSPQGEFSADSRTSIRTTGKGRWSKKLTSPTAISGQIVTPAHD